MIGWERPRGTAEGRRSRSGLEGKLAIAAALICATVIAVGGLTGAAATPGATGTGSYLVNDYGTGLRVRNILPAGENGNTTAVQFLQGKQNPPVYPPHQYDQRAPYDGPSFVAGGVVSLDQMLQFTKPETFGVPDDQIESVETPKPGLTIIRDKAAGVPHIFATTKSLAKFGAGWVSAEDRMFMMDALRHAGRGNLASLVGSSGFGSDCSTHYGTGYDQADADYQRSLLDPRIVQDALDFTAGINAYVQSPGFLLNPPVEYTPGIFPPPIGPNAWTVDDTGAVAALIGSQLGGGGGNEVANTLAYEKLVAKYGVVEGRKIFDDFHAADVPGPTTIDQAFPYESRSQRDPASVALINGGPSDPNGCTHTSVPPAGAAGATAAATKSNDPKTAAVNRALQLVASVRSAFPRHMSNATVVNASQSVDGHPIAVFGSQAAYFQPEIFMEMDVHAPGWDARGVQFPGTGVLVELGRGQDFAWSATSAGSDNIDTRVERLCNPASADPLQGVAANSTFYYYKGQCLPMQELPALQYVVPPSPGSLPPGAWTGIETFTRERTVHDDGVAIVQGRTTANVIVAGQPVAVPVAISVQRTNFLHELEQASGFEDWNDPGIVHDAQSFITAAAKVDTTFNWFYVDSKDTAYYSSGKLPIRNPRADPDLLNWATGEWDWQGILPPSQHPHAINPSRGWMTSWNNRPAPHWGASDSNWDYGSLYRNQLLDRELQKHLAAGGGKVSLLDVFNTQVAASITDFRSQRLVDLLDAVIGDPAGLTAPEQAALAAVNSWHAAGDLRQSPSDGAPYAHADGISIFDAWYPHVIKAIYDPWLDPANPDLLCDPAHNELGGIPKTFDNPPNDGHCYGDFSGFNVGSAFDGGWYDAINTDLRQVLGQNPAGAHSNLYCGGARGSGTPVQGSLAACRQELLAALDKGIAGHQANYATLTAGDRLDYRALGLQGLPTAQWTNKPTEIQVVEFLNGRSELPAVVAGGGMPNTAAAAPLWGLGLGVALPGLVLAVRRRRRRATPSR